jgi:hypothetical protein
MALDLFIYRLPFEPSEIDDRSRRCDVEWRNDMTVFGELAGHDVKSARWESEIIEVVQLYKE